MSILARTISACALWLAFMLRAVSPSQAQDIGEDDAVYRDAIHAALAAYERDDLAEAREHFARAYERYPNARALRGLGTVALEQRDYVAAAIHLERALSTNASALSGELRAQTEAMLGEANAHVGRLQVLTSPAHANVHVDGVPQAARGTPLVLKPGVYVLEVSCEGYRSETRQVLVVAAQQQLLHWDLVRLEPAVPLSVPQAATVDRPPASAKPWLIISAGAATLGGGAALLAAGFRERHAINAAAPGELSYADWRDKRDRYPMLLGAGGALMGVGALALAAGIWWRVRTRRELALSFAADRLLLRAEF